MPRILLNTEDKDLDFIVNEDKLGGHSLDNYMWAGCRANYGVKVGKVAFQVRLESGTLCRVGWGTSSASLALGQCDQSFGYGGTGKKSTGNQFIEYGERFGRGDTIIALLDADSGSVSFMKNGLWLGVAFCIPQWLSGVALFPHVLIKDAFLSINFGEKERHRLPPLLEGYRYISQVSVLEPSPWGVTHKMARVTESEFEESEEVAEPEVVYAAAPDLRGGGPGQKRLIMLIGLPSSGKTFWAKKFIQQHPFMKFQILSVNLIMERKMPNTKHMFEDRFQKLVKDATDTLNQMLRIAANESGNIIWDQTNIYPVARKKKLAEFKGFRKTAVVFLPDEQTMSVWRTRQFEQTGQRAPDQVIAEMQRAFTFPEVDDENFDEVVYAFGNSPSNRRELLQRYKMDSDAFFRGEKKRYADAPSETLVFDPNIRKDDYCKSYGERQFTASNPYKPQQPYVPHKQAINIQPPSKKQMCAEEVSIKSTTQFVTQYKKPDSTHEYVDVDEEDDEPEFLGSKNQTQTYETQYIQYIYSS